MIDLERNVQVKITLRLEIKGGIRVIEKRQGGAVAHLEKGMQHPGLAAGFGSVDLQCAGERQTEKILVEGAGLL